MARQTLRKARLSPAPFDGQFFRRAPGLWPIEAAASVFATRQQWPAPEEYLLAFRGAPAPVRFEPAGPARRVPGQPLDLDSMYDACIVRGVVPTRPCNWHDFMNALVWATFPQAKAALHRRQHELIRAWVPPGATRLPNARTREQDALALLDEGGILLLQSAGRCTPIPFGHGFFEGLALGTMALLPRGFVLECRELPCTPAEQLLQADALLAAAVEGPLRWVPFELSGGLLQLF
jgi:hypothetical protein